MSDAILNDFLILHCFSCPPSAADYQMLLPGRTPAARHRSRCAITVHQLLHLPYCCIVVVLCCSETPPPASADSTYAYVTVWSTMMADSAVLELDGRLYRGRHLVVEVRRS